MEASNSKSLDCLLLLALLLPVLSDSPAATSCSPIAVMGLFCYLSSISLLLVMEFFWCWLLVCSDAGLALLDCPLLAAPH